MKLNNYLKDQTNFKTVMAYAKRDLIFNVEMDNNTVWVDEDDPDKQWIFQLTLSEMSRFLSTYRSKIISRPCKQRVDKWECFIDGKLSRDFALNLLELRNK